MPAKALFFVCVGLALPICESVASGGFGSQVEEIITTGQSYDGEQIDNLVALGPDAVPAIGAALNRGVRFPAVLVFALERIGSKNGMSPLLSFLESQDLDSTDDSLSVITILALRNVGNPGACQPLSSILDVLSVTPRIRLSAARSMASLCASKDAQDFVLSAYQDLSNPNVKFSGYFQDDVLLGLIDVDNDESRAILVGLLHSWAEVRVLVPIIDYLSSQGGQDVVDGLIAVVDGNPLHEMPIRVAALRALLNMDEQSKQSLATRTTALALEAESEGWPQAKIVEIRQLSAIASSK